VPLYCGRFLARAFLGGFLVELTASQLGQNTGLLAGAFETTQSCVEVLAFSYSYARHLKLANDLPKKNVPAWPAEERHISRPSPKL
jgi:hypothetical protein